MEIKFAMTDYQNTMVNVTVNMVTREYAIESDLSEHSEAHILDELRDKVVPLVLDSKLEIVELKYLHFMEDEELVPGFLYSTNLVIAKVYTMGSNSVIINNEISMMIEKGMYPIAVKGGNLTGIDPFLKVVETDFGYSFPYVIFDSLRTKEVIQGITHYPYRTKYTDIVSPLTSSVKLGNNIIFSYDNSAMILVLHEDDPSVDKKDIDAHMNYLMGIIDAEEQFWMITHEVLSFYAEEEDEDEEGEE